jgi:UDP-N-acetylmuramyl pentapeptide phosphotransferase/UDP-N-acetylglucosamine-1-phosphate transferase
MGGGLFGTPLALNPKCLVFSAFVLFVYWMPHPGPYSHRVVVAFLLATVSYVLLAWYDMIFDCNDQLKPTILGWMSMPFKPPQYRTDFENLPVKYQKIVRGVDIFILIVMLGLLALPYVYLK